MSILTVDPLVNCSVNVKVAQFVEVGVPRKGEDVKRETRRACACELAACRSKVVSLALSKMG